MAGKRDKPLGRKDEPSQKTDKGLEVPSTMCLAVTRYCLSSTLMVYPVP
jgi:hypothetical protein